MHNPCISSKIPLEKCLIRLICLKPTPKEDSSKFGLFVAYLLSNDLVNDAMRRKASKVYMSFKKIKARALVN